ncbi:MAG: DUF3048 domain-containing protein [Propionibacteriaceae bacterium]|nr:DUF3048 domain-containing protein [Propionibacteriaceae bacterium]
MKWTIIGVVVALVLAGGVLGAYFLGWLKFGEPESKPTLTMAYTPRPSEAPVWTPTPGPPLKPQWPLSGVRGDIAEHPALVVKVENAPESRPQDGLEYADIVFEEMVEGGISRLVAVFHSTVPAQIAPIRSIRPMDGPIAAWTRGLMIFSGGQYPYVARAENDGLQIISMDYGADGFSRVDGRPSPHDVAGDTAAFFAQADGDHQVSPPAFAVFVEQGGAGTAQIQGTVTTQVSTQFSYMALPSWTWDSASATWLRFEDGEPAMTYAGPQISAKNVIVLTVSVVYTSQADAAGSSVPESIVVGEGTGVVASGPMTAAITWRHDSETAPWQFFGPNGAPLELLPGNTWVELVPDSGSWSVS